MRVMEWIRRGILAGVLAVAGGLLAGEIGTFYGIPLPEEADEVVVFVFEEEFWMANAKRAQPMYQQTIERFAAVAKQYRSAPKVGVAVLSEGKVVFGVAPGDPGNEAHKRKLLGVLKYRARKKGGTGGNLAAARKPFALPKLVADWGVSQVVYGAMRGAPLRAYWQWAVWRGVAVRTSLPKQQKGRDPGAGAPPAKACVAPDALAEAVMSARRAWDESAVGKAGKTLAIHAILPEGASWWLSWHACPEPDVFPLLRGCVVLLPRTEPMLDFRQVDEEGHFVKSVGWLKCEATEAPETVRPGEEPGFWRHEVRPGKVRFCGVDLPEEGARVLVVVDGGDFAMWDFGRMSRGTWGDTLRNELKKLAFQMDAVDLKRSMEGKEPAFSLGLAFVNIPAGESWVESFVPSMEPEKGDFLGESHRWQEITHRAAYARRRGGKAKKGEGMLIPRPERSLWATLVEERITHVFLVGGASFDLETFSMVAGLKAWRGEVKTERDFAEYMKKVTRDTKEQEGLAGVAFPNVEKESDLKLGQRAVAASVKIARDQAKLYRAFREPEKVVFHGVAWGAKPSFLLHEVARESGGVYVALPMGRRQEELHGD